jgi:hypothetical protein
LDFGRAGVLVVRLIVLDNLLLLSHIRVCLIESGVPLRAANETTHMISVADRISILAVQSPHPIARQRSGEFS